MKRREFLRAAGAGLAASAIAAPAIAQSMSELKWRLTASWPKSLDTLYGCCEDFSKNVAKITDDNFQIQVFAYLWGQVCDLTFDAFQVKMLGRS